MSENDLETRAGGPTDEAAQAEIVAFLADPAAHGGAAVEQVETHISRIFLAGARALKLKRAIRTNYLDFSTPALREAACRREIAVNAAAGALYRGVVPVTREAGGALALDGEGPALDWVVEMRRFDRSAEFDRLLEAGRLDAALIEKLADAVADAHAAAPDARAHGGAQATLARIDQIADAALAAPDAPRAEVGAWRDAARAAAAAQARLLDVRALRGCVRRCHGDLHLRNIVLIEGRPTPFDAIEFSEEIASVDVLYDLALALVDLAMRGRVDLANVALGRWLSASRDHSGLALGPLYLSMRAAVRGMVAAASGSAGAAQDEFAYARRALRAPPAPRLITIGGVSGTGKTTLARALAPHLGGPLGAVAIRSDVARKRLLGAPPEARLPRSAYSAEVSARVAARMLAEARRSLRAGWSVALDATFLDPRDRAAAQGVAARMGARFDGLWLRMPIAAAAERVRARLGDASDADAALVFAQADRAAAPEGWRALDASGAPEAVAQAARAALG